jgi:hypothetical protein
MACADAGRKRSDFTTKREEFRNSNFEIFPFVVNELLPRRSRCTPKEDLLFLECIDCVDARGLQAASSVRYLGKMIIAAILSHVQMLSYRSLDSRGSICHSFGMLFHLV